MRKGQYTVGHKWVYFIVALLLLSFMFLYLRSGFQSAQIDLLTCTDDITDQIIVAKVLYDQDCFVYTDQQTQRAIPGIIDINKFTQEQYDSCFQRIDKKVTVTIGDLEIGEVIQNPKTITKPILLATEEQTTAGSITLTFADAGC